MTNQSLEVAQQAQETSKPAVEVKDTAEQGVLAEAQQEQAVEDTKPKTPEERVRELEEALERTKKGSQKAIDRQTAARKALEDKFNQLQQKLSEMPSAASDTGPKESDFETWEEFRKAEVEHEAKKLADKRIKEAREAELKALQEQKMEALKRDLDIKEAKFRETVTDYDKAKETLGAIARDLQAAGMNVAGLANMVLEFDNPPAMFYELAKVDGLIDDIVKLPPMSMMRELVKLEMTIQNKPQIEKKAPPAPIKGVQPTGRGKKALHEMSFEEREAYFSKK